ncbi:MAG: hypothetical protein HZC28_20680 [Spirochaetes bacterium]|nr:hypothetical protein [Spirochaetota bacterium]
MDLLDIGGIDPVPGLYCVLENEPEKAAAMAAAVKEMNFKTHIKIKLYGKHDLDKSIITAVRNVMGSDTYIVGDVNCGYRVTKSTEPLDEIARLLLELHAVGLNACEDPADMSIEQWVALQKKVDTLDLIPDHIMRPAAAAVNTIVPGMGSIYNIHPGCMGSVIDAVRLATKVKSFGAKLMIGDDSLIGPSLTAWQQVAIGTQAEWVEAVEKQGESEVFLECVRSQVTFRDANGNMAMKKPKPGFGQDIDVDAVRSKAVASIVI